MRYGASEAAEVSPWKVETFSGADAVMTSMGEIATALSFV